MVWKAMDKELEQRLIDLEIKFSYQNELLEELNQIVIRQQKEIDLLTKELMQFTGAKSGILDQGIKSLKDETPPPHY